MLAGVVPENEFNDFQPNSLRNVTANFQTRISEFFSSNTESNRGVVGLGIRARDPKIRVSKLGRVGPPWRRGEVSRNSAGEKIANDG
jgi:hypothetical protein